MKNKHIGSNFDDFLKEEDILEEVEAAAIKQVIAYDLQQEMEKNRNPLVLKKLMNPLTHV